MSSILVLNGPNLKLLGTREPATNSMPSSPIGLAASAVSSRSIGD